MDLGKEITIPPEDLEFYKDFDTLKKDCGCRHNFDEIICSTDGITYPNECLFACDVIRNEEVEDKPKFLQYGACPPEIAEKNENFEARKKLITWKLPYEKNLKPAKEKKSSDPGTDNKIKSFGVKLTEAGKKLAKEIINQIEP